MHKTEILSIPALLQRRRQTERKWECGIGRITGNISDWISHSEQLGYATSPKTGCIGHGYQEFGSVCEWKGRYLIRALVAVKR